MATPSAFRLAVEACRPSKSSVARTRPLIQSKRFLSSTRPVASTDILSGFPMPKISEDLPSGALQTRQSPPHSSQPPSNVSLQHSKPLPPNVLATHLQPLRHRPQYGLPVASLQLRSYSLRNLEFFADWILRAAFYLKLPARGPVPLPKRRERWTVIKSNFVHKKSQENFQRITYKRLITILDGETETVERWLAFVRKHQFYGVGMKANVWGFESLDVGEQMDMSYASKVEGELAGKLAEFGFNSEVSGKGATVERLMRREGMKVQGVPMAEVRERSLTPEGKRWIQGLPEEVEK